jgi:hypothetical protein
MKNVKNFGNARYVSTELDMMRPHIQSILQGEVKQIKNKFTLWI